MSTLVFTGRQDKMQSEMVLEAKLGGKTIAVRLSKETLDDFGLVLAQRKAIFKAKAGRLEPDGTIRVRVADFSD